MTKPPPWSWYSGRTRQLGPTPSTEGDTLGSDPALRGMDVHHDSLTKRTDARAVDQDDETMFGLAHDGHPSMTGIGLFCGIHGEGRHDDETDAEPKIGADAGRWL